MELPNYLYVAGSWQTHMTTSKCGPQAAPAGTPAWWTTWLAPCRTTPLTASLSAILLWQNNWTSMPSCYVRAKACKCGVTKLANWSLVHRLQSPHQHLSRVRKQYCLVLQHLMFASYPCLALQALLICF